MQNLLMAHIEKWDTEEAYLALVLSWLDPLPCKSLKTDRLVFICVTATQVQGPGIFDLYLHRK